MSWGFIKKLGNVQSAQDFTQDVFLKLHRSRMQYAATLPFAPWLFSITRSVWIDGLKKRQNDEPTDHLFLEKLAPRTEPVFQSIPLEALDHLLPNQSTAVSMKVYDDATFEEIATRLETSPQNARQLVSRGLRKLKEVMKPRKDSL
ncbi:MAG: RNA polymerase sigma factor [Deltaproteobacteria bacterium]|nr:MAG: RNA polymerase sigma factor [Deltaproteobacteria bacterium]